MQTKLSSATKEVIIGDGSPTALIQPARKVWQKHSKREILNLSTQKLFRRQKPALILLT